MHQGDYWIGGAEYRPSPSDTAGQILGDGSQGTLTSPEFQIVGPQITFLIGGGSNVTETRAELLINGSIVLKAAGENMEVMVRKSWNTTEYVGQTARLRLVDNTSGGWGHINFDDFRGDIAFCNQGRPY